MTELLREPLAAIRRVQDQKLACMLRLCAQGHLYYRQSWSEAGVDLASVHGVDELHRLPLTPKQDLIADPEDFRLSCPDLPLHERALWEVLYTTGTSGSPTPLYGTTHDYYTYLFMARRVAEISGINDRDVIANLFPLAAAAMGAYVRSSALAYAAGAAVVGGLTGAPYGAMEVHRSLDEAVRLVERHKATVLWGVTSFVRRVVIRAAELGADFTHVRMCAITGEASSPAMRSDVRARLRALGASAPVIFNRYGNTESGGLAQCCEEGDWHNPAPELLYHEVVDPETGAPLADGERGSLAITHLDRRGSVLIRYLVGDEVSLTHTPCPNCGRTGDRLIGPVVRTKDLIKVKGMLINPAALLDTIEAVPDVDEFQVVVGRQDPVDPFSMDEMVIRVATPRPDREVFADAIVRAAAEAVGVRPRVVFAAARDIYDPVRQPKAVRLVDQR